MGKETTEGPQWRQRRTLLLWNLQQRWRETGKKQARQITSGLRNVGTSKQSGETDND